MPILKGNLHTHTTFSDGRLTPELVLEKYRAFGYHFLAFTDHRCHLGPDGHVDYFQKLPATTKDFTVLRGVEEEPEILGGRHLGLIYGEHETLRIINHPSEYGLSVDQVNESVRIAGADAVEVTYHGRYFARYDVEDIVVPKVATDDSHHPEEIGCSWIEVDAVPEADAIIRAIRAGDFAIVIDRALLR